MSAKIGLLAAHGNVKTTSRKCQTGIGSPRPNGRPLGAMLGRGLGNGRPSAALTGRSWAHGASYWLLENVQFLYTYGFPK